MEIIFTSPKTGVYLKYVAFMMQKAILKSIISI